MTSMRRSRITRSLLVTAALVALPISGLAQDAPRGTLRIGFESGIQHLDPALAYDQVGVPLMHSMFDTSSVTFSRVNVRAQMPLSRTNRFENGG